MTRKAELFCDWLYGPKSGGSDKRPWHVLTFAKGLTDAEGTTFWAVITEHWSGFDLIPHAEFETQFLRFAGTAPGAKTSNDIRLYRGQNAESPIGLSWTFCSDVADTFARGHRWIMNEDPVVLETFASPKQIAFYCNERGESEYVLLYRPVSYWLMGKGGGS